jgi:hypothetical protein
VFNTIKHNQTGKISFEVSNHSLCHALDVSRLLVRLCCGSGERVLRQNAYKILVGERDEKKSFLRVSC